METRKKKSFKRLFAFLMAFVMVTSLAVSAVFAADPTFKDVPKDHDFYEEIEDLAEREIIGGYGGSRKGYFGPEDELTRAQAAKIVAGAAGLKASPWFKSKLTDVDETVDMYEHIWALEEAEVVKGFGTSNLYKPADNITRGHVSKIIVKAFGLSLGDGDADFSDLPDDEEVADAIKILASNGIVKGYGSSGEFRPDRLVTRGEFSKMIYGTLKVVESDVEVKKVTAITEFVDKTTPGYLEFTINNETKAFDLDRFKGTDYEVEFQATTGVFDATTATKSDTGKLDVSLIGAVYSSALKSFQYRVVILLDGEEVAKSALKTVVVVDATEIIKPTALAIDYDSSLWDLDYVTMSDTPLTVVVSKGLNAFGKEIDLNKGASDYIQENCAQPLTFSSSNHDVAMIGLTTGVLQLEGVGKTTIKAKIGTKNEVSMILEVKAKQVSTSLLEKSAVEMETSSSGVFVFTVLDQFGEEMRFVEDQGDTPPQVKWTVATGKEAKVITLAGSDPIIVYDDGMKVAYTKLVEGEDKLLIKKNGKAFATISVEILEEYDADDVTKYEVVIPKTSAIKVAKVDIYADRDKPEEEKKLSIAVNSYVGSFLFEEQVADVANDLDVPTFGTAWKFETSNDKVFTISGNVIVPVGVGKAKAQLILESGSASVVYAEMEIEIVSTAPEVKYVTFDTDYAQVKKAGNVKLDSLIKTVKDADGANRKFFELVGGKVVIYDVKTAAGSTNKVKIGEVAVVSPDLTSLDFETAGEDIVLKLIAGNKGAVSVRVYDLKSDGTLGLVASFSIDVNIPGA